MVEPVSRTGPVMAHRTMLPPSGEAMSTRIPPIKNGIVSRVDSIARQISGPHWEPATVSNATTYWRCESCGYEPLHERDLHRESFHAQNCEVRR